MTKRREQIIKTSAASRPAATAALALLAIIGTAALLPTRADGWTAPDGQSLFQRRCTACHALDADHEGPRLRGVFGRPSGTVKTFKYSDALQKVKLTWDEATLDKWLTDTESVAPDNDMSFRVSNQEERAAIISYLKSLSTH
jgi:cytochrome c